MIGIAAGCLLGSTARALAAVGDTVVFSYGTSISKPPATESQLGMPPWATVTLTEQAGGLFWMDIDTSFNSTQSPPSDPSLTQLAFSLNTDYSSFGKNAFSLVSPFCEPNSSATKTTCDAYYLSKNPGIALSCALDGEGITGSAQPHGGFDLQVQLPPPGVKLDNSQSPIRLFIQGPTDTFRVDDFVGDVSKDGYQTAAKIQELNPFPVGCDQPPSTDSCTLPPSTVITGESGGEDPIPRETQAPAPIPVLGGTAAWAVTRRLRRRVKLAGGVLPALGSA